MVSPGEWKKTLPEPSWLTQPFWDATKAGKLELQRCTTCGEYVWTPQMACRSCLTETLEWAEVSGRGSVYSFVNIYRPANPAYTAPYTIVVVDLEEGPRIFSDLVGIAPEDVRIGMPVAVEFEDVGPVGLYHFRPRT